MSEDRFAHLRAASKGEGGAATVRQGAASARDSRGQPIAVAIVEDAPIEKRRDWWELFFENYRVSGDAFAAMKAVGLTHGQYKKCLRIKDFRERVDSLQLTLNSSVKGALFKTALSGNVQAQVAYLKAHDPAFADKRTVEHVVTQKDVKNMEKRALEAGVDPSRVIALVEEQQRNRGKLKSLPGGKSQQEQAG